MASNLPLKLVHIPAFRSSRVVWLYHELAALYGPAHLPPLQLSTFADIAAFRSHKPQWLLDINPNGKVPSMRHGNVSMFEGGAICAYLLDQFDTSRRLLPRDSEAVAKFYLWSHWCASTLDNLTASSSPTQRVHMGTTDEGKRSDDVTLNIRYFNEVAAPQLERELADGRTFLCGQAFTAVDVVVGYWLKGTAVKMQPPWVSADRYGLLFQYYLRTSSRPGFQAAVAAVPDTHCLLADTEGPATAAAAHTEPHIAKTQARGGADLVGLTERYFQLSNQHDTAQIRGLFADEGVTYDSNGTGLHHGVEAIMQMKQSFFSQHPSVRWSVDQPPVLTPAPDGDGGSVAVHFTMRWDGFPDVTGLETVTFDRTGKIVKVEVRRAA